MDKLKLFFANWKTTIPAVLAAVCATDSAYLKILPPEWEQHGTALCIFLVSIGLIAAKDADKTHSKVIVQPQPDPVTVPIEGSDKGKVVAPVILLLLAGLLTGCSSLKGTMLDGRFCTMAGNEQVQQDIATIVDSYTDQKDKDRVALYLRTAKLGGTVLCEMARDRQAVQEKG